MTEQARKAGQAGRSDATIEALVVAPGDGGGEAVRGRSGLLPELEIHPVSATEAMHYGGVVAEIDAWVRAVIGQHHPLLGRRICPFVPLALEQGSLSYAGARGCRSPADVVVVMEELVARFPGLPPLAGPEAQLKTLVAVFVDVEAADAERVVIAAHRELKDRCTERGLMVGEFAPGYLLPSTRCPELNVGEAPAPVLALRYMLPSDRRFLLGADRWLAAWAARFGAGRVPLFRAFSAAELAAVARAGRVVRVEAGHTLCRQGEPGEEFFLILEGEVEIERDGEQVARLGPGGFFGELALLANRPRTATVGAITDTTLLVLDRRGFRRVVETVPGIAGKLLVELAGRFSDLASFSAGKRRPLPREDDGLVPVSAAALVPVLFGHAAFQQLNAACELGLLELLHERPGLSAAEVGERLGLAERSAQMLLLGASALGLIDRAGGRYANAAVVEDLFGAEGWSIFRDLVEFEAKIAYHSHGEYVASLRENANTGLRWFAGSEPDLYRRLAHTPELQEVFYRCMDSWSRVGNAILTGSDWFEGCSHVLDLGGGGGGNALALARAHPGVRITLLDLESVVMLARERITAAGLGARIHAVAGDLFTAPYPDGCDCVLLANQIVIWSPEQNLRLIRRAFRALPEGGRLVVFNEFADDSLDGPLYAALDNVYFATLPTAHSRIYPAADCVGWAREAGFAEAAFFPGRGWTPHGAVVAVK
jgi:L-tyrosine C(3)-methyltransferase